MIDRRKIRETTNTRFTRRALFVFGTQLGIGGLLGARMYQLQVVETGYYRNRAERSRIRPRLLPPVRGEIMSSDGKPLAENRQNYRVVLTREQSDDVRDILARLAEIIPLTPERQTALYEQIRKSSPFSPVLIEENLKWDEFAAINANVPALPGVSSEPGLTRHYPQGATTAHIVGYVAPPSEEEVKRAGKARELLKMPGMRIGKAGIEKSAETELRGTAGKSSVERNVHGRVIRELSRKEGTQGDDLTLTINLDLQKYAMERLEGEAGAIVVMDVIDGDVHALASSPGYDPNVFVLGLSQKQWKELSSNEKRPLSNKAVSGQYPPGSTFKMLTALAALDAGVILPSDGVFCSGSINFGNRDFHCWKSSGHGLVDLNSAIQKSCDVYFYEIALRVGIDKIADVARRFGLGVKPNIELPNVNPGLMPDKDWKRAMRGEPWYQGETLIAGIGQGYVSATPLQLAVMTARIANGGYKVDPRLIKARNGQALQPSRLIGTGISEAHIHLIREAMSISTNVAGGTSYSSRIIAKGKQMAGKTGTAQVRRISTAERATGILTDDELPWKLRDHALFVAFAPEERPRYAISVVVEHGGGGSVAAAPIARDVLLRAQYGGEPPPDAVPDEASPIFGLDPTGPV